MLPNRFPDQGEMPDTAGHALWFVVAVYDFLEAAKQRDKWIAKADRKALDDAVDAILAGYARGTRHGIHVDDDGLLAAGVPGIQLTWMDAKVGDWVVTPRIGKPVEVQALWLNALRIGAERWAELYARAQASFEALDQALRRRRRRTIARAPSTAASGRIRSSPSAASVPGSRGAGARAGSSTRSRPALGVDRPRSLAPGSAAYAPHYEGGVRERDGAYHQGTIWPWLLGAFVDAWVRVRGGTREAKAQARARFLAPLLAHLEEAGLGHVSEIVDAEPPHTPRGCPFQAWSVGEAIRIADVILAHEP
jgi:glycogen debranching enzyme